MSGWLGGAYDWVKAAHLVFVIFWMAGLFMLPRYLVYHQEALAAGRSDEAALWITRETKLRTIILSPAMIAVWVLGLMLAANLGLFEGGNGLGWLHAKLLLVLLLSGYHGWAVGYAKKLATNRPTASGRTLRLVNEVPALMTALIVVLVIVKPF
ncbi:MAG TPA: CopD family protein [Sphingomonas sp.]|jgi:putative membrane protein|nr:CopD family protein [Sphingomonas sp.]